MVDVVVINPDTVATLANGVVDTVVVNSDTVTTLANGVVEIVEVNSDTVTTLANGVVEIVEVNFHPVEVAVGVLGPQGPIGEPGMMYLDLWLGTGTLNYNTDGTPAEIDYGNNKRKLFTYSAGLLTQIDYYTDTAHYRKTINYTGADVASINLETL